MTRGEEDFVALNPEVGVFLDGDDFFSGLFDRELFGCLGFTKIPNRADEAGRGAWGAKGLTQLHESGIKEAGIFWIEEFVG